MAGTHGKTTTSALIAVILDTAGFDPTFHVGSELLNYGLFGRYGRGNLLVAEADEFDRRFLDYDPEIAVVTSVEADHLDYFGDVGALRDAFQSFLQRVRPGGGVIVCADDPGAAGLHCDDGVERITYGWAEDADWQLLQWSPISRSACGFSVRTPQSGKFDFAVSLLGKHNALNAVATVAACSRLDVPMDTIARGLRTFGGTRRRFEVVGEVEGISVADDYAHHPTAIRATLAAARAHFGAGIWAIFQPHTAHRTQSLFDEFTSCFDDADHLILTPTYRPAGREAPAEDPTVPALAAAMRHPDVRLMGAASATATIAASARPGELVLIMGAGDISSIAPDIVAKLRSRERLAS